MSAPSKTSNWIEQSFEKADLGDERLSKRLLLIAEKMGNRPEGSIPQQMGNWNDTKSCYKFLNNEAVTHKRIQTPHRKLVKTLASEGGSGHVTLFIQDTSELDYTSLKASKGLGYIGNHKNNGIMFHSCLAMRLDAGQSKVLGLAHQQVWTRQKASLRKTQTRSERNHRKNKESEVWIKNLKAIGPPPEGQTWVAVGDRANDIFEYFVESKRLGWESVVRASQDRKIFVGEQENTLMNHMRSLPSQGTKMLTIRKTTDTKKRDLVLNITWEQVHLNVPARLKKQEPCSLWAVRCWNEEEELEWILYSTIPVENVMDATKVSEWYAKRWIVEEYHKCLKTGCQLESSQLESRKGLENLLAVLAIIAIKLLYLRDLSREHPDRLAKDIVDEKAIKIINKRYHLPYDMNIGIFCSSVAKLGGFLGRKSDGHPGWQTLWKGWLRLLDMMWGMECFENV